MQSVGISGHYRLEVRNAETHQLRDFREFDNLITNEGLDSYGDPDSLNLERCFVGTGMTAPSIYDTSLRAQYAYVDGVAENTQIAPVAPDWVSAARNRYRFPVGTATGNVAEVGIGGSRSPFMFFSRALVLDAQGQQSPITVLANEYLDVIYTMRLHPVLTDIPFSFELGGETYTGTARPAYIQESRNTASRGVGVTGCLVPNSGVEIYTLYNGGTLGEITEEIKNPPASYNAHQLPWAIQPYTRGNYFRDFKVTISLDAANMAGGIKAMLVGPRGIGNYSQIGAQFAMQTQILLDRAIPKDSTNSLIVTLRAQWGRWTGS